MSVHELKLPRLGETMESGVLVAWHKQPGESFRRGEILADVETDKTVVELPALHDGEMLEALAEPGQTIEVGTAIARYASEAPVAADPDQAPASSSTAQPKAREGHAGKQRSAGRPRGKHASSPRARRLARTLGVDAGQLRGTGRNGRVVGADVLAAAGSNASSGQAQKVASHPMPLVHWPAGRRTSRPPLVLVHGLFGNSASWRPLIPALAGSDDVYAVDLPGHGSNASADATAAAEQLAAALRAHVAPPVRLAGMSWGAIIAAQAAALLGSDCCELSLLAPAGLSGKLNADFVEGMLSAQTPEDLDAPLRLLGPAAASLSPEVRTAMARDLAERSSVLRSIVEQAFPAGRPGVGLADLLEPSGYPVRALFGLEDAIQPWANAAHLPVHTSSSFLPAAGHMLIWDAPQAVAAWLKGHA